MGERLKENLKNLEKFETFLKKKFGGFKYLMFEEILEKIRDFWKNMINSYRKNIGKKCWGIFKKVNYE